MRLLIINDLGGNCSHAIDKYASYAYPCLPVGVRWHGFRRMFAFAGALTIGGLAERWLGAEVLRERVRAARWARPGRDTNPVPCSMCIAVAGGAPEKSAGWGNESNLSVPEWE